MPFMSSSTRRDTTSGSLAINNDTGSQMEEGELTEDDQAAARPNLAQAKSSTAATGKKRWLGCSSVEDFELLDKVGEGTFGYVHRPSFGGDKC